MLEASAFASDFIAWIGAVTAVGAALLAVVQTDIKRVLAYSTISQLAYMMFALGVGAYPAAVFHLMTHAFFKPLLFLGAGSVSHTTNTFDMTKMGGLRRAMPVTYITFVVGSLSLAGIIPLAGFWSKDEILIDAWDHNKGIFIFGLIAVGLTAFYMFRVISLTFHGDYRGGEPPAPDEHGVDPSHPHESPRNMTMPMAILALMAVIAGWITFGGEFQTWVNGALPQFEEGHFEWRTGIFLASTALAVVGIGGAVLIYQRGLIDVAALRAAPVVAPVDRLLANKFYMDVLAEELLVRRLFYGGGARLAAVFDVQVIDATVNGVWRATFGLGRWGRLAQNGQVQTAAAGLIGGAAVIWGVVVIF